jgi:hypothetical protein
MATAVLRANRSSCNIPLWFFSTSACTEHSFIAPSNTVQSMASRTILGGKALFCYALLLKNGSKTPRAKKRTALVRLKA